MKRLLLLSTLSILMTSCASTYFYSTISSLSNDIFQTEEGDFISETDSLLVAYWFNGENAPIFINIYNKSQSPLYVDWNRSSIITKQESTSYNNKIVSMSDEDDMVSTESVSFIPPMSRKTFSSHSLSNFSYDDMTDTYFKKTKIANKSGFPVEVKSLEFTKNTTPLRFRSYLTFYNTIPGETFSKEHEFYISELLKTKSLSPTSMPENLALRGDLFYIEKKSKNKAFGQVVVGTVIVGAIVGLGIAYGDHEVITDYYE